MLRYQKVTPAIVEELRAIVGSKHVIYGDANLLEMYSHDEIPDSRLAKMPEVVVKPKTAREISDILKLANRELIPVTPRGAGSGESGGAIPIYGGIVLALERMNQILEIDHANMVVVVEPGVVTSAINETLKKDGLMFAGYSADTCFIGGNIAENAGGAKAVKYGVTDRYVLGLETVLPDGEIVQFGGKCVKDVAGYNLLHLLVGSEGTLGIFTKIFLRLLPVPTVKRDLLVLFKDVPTPIQLVPEIITKLHIIPAALEFIDHLSLKMGCDILKDNLPYQNAGAALLIELDGVNEEEIDKEMERIGELCMEKDALEVYVGSDRASQDRIWAIRHSIPEGLRAFSLVQSVEDVVVPIALIPNLVAEVHALAEKYNLLIPCYGHAGDGNLHATLLKRPETSLEEWYRAEDEALKELYSYVTSLGGTISGEHGIGIKRRGYLSRVMDQRINALSRQIKSVFDPNLILNPDKIFE
ncbi:MAG: FAD-binding protein [Anaerolineae bacterium]|nr:FAD-binding protein [Anaerolineae bacterium]